LFTIKQSKQAVQTIVLDSSQDVRCYRNLKQGKKITHEFPFSMCVIAASLSNNKPNLSAIDKKFQQLLADKVRRSFSSHAVFNGFEYCDTAKKCSIDNNVNEIIDKFPSIAEDSKLNHIHIPDHIQKFPVDVKHEIVNILRTGIITENALCIDQIEHFLAVSQYSNPLKTACEEKLLRTKEYPRRRHGDNIREIHE
jgi:hypothetical protein